MAKKQEVKEALKTYVVVKSGVIVKKGGEALELHKRIELTDTKAKHLVNKVRLLKDYELESESDKALKLDLDKSKKSNNKLVEDNKALNQQIEKLMEELSKKK